jgi:hypothetical protein
VKVFVQVKMYYNERMYAFKAFWDSCCEELGCEGHNGALCSASDMLRRSHMRVHAMVPKSGSM